MKKFDHYPWVPSPVRGHPPHVACTTDDDYIERLQHVDYMIAQAPDLQHSGRFPEYEWVTLYNTKTKHLGHPLMTR
eukprot:942773-Pyramimonas_sp.AAC.1